MGIAIGILALSIALLAVVTADETTATPPDDYEWRPPVKLNDLDQVEYSTLLMEDGATGDIFMIYDSYENVTGPQPVETTSKLAVFNEASGTFSDLLEWDPVDRNDVLVHNGTLYRVTRNARTGTVSILVDDDDVPTQLIDYEHENIGIFDVDLLEVKEGKLLMVTLRGYNYWYPDYEFHFIAEYLEVTLDTFTVTNTTILYTDDRLYDNYFIEYLEGIVYILWQPEDNYDNWIYCFRYAEGDGIMEGPIAIHENTGITTDEYWWPHIDPEGNIHLVFGDQGPSMSKYSPDGTLLGELNLTGVIMTTSTPYFGWFPLVVNETGYVYLFHYNAYNNYIRALVIDPDYSTDYRTETIANGEFDRRTLNIILDNSDNVMVVWALEEFEIKKIWYSYQTPLTPDLEVDPATFSFVEADLGQDEGLSFSVRNMGRAVATSYTVNVSWKKADTDIYGIVGSQYVGEPLGRLDLYPLTFPTDLAGGNYLFRIEIVSVMPLENNIRNNVVETWIYVKDKAPELTVLWPHDGHFVDDIIHYQGRTFDREDPDGVITYIDVPGSGYPRQINGSGDWNLTVDVSSVRSGGYGLWITAYDGERSTTVRLKIWVDHPGETLTVATFYPEANVSLIVGEGQVFDFVADDRFDRPINYTWTIDGLAVSEGSSSFAYLAETSGKYYLRAQATNTYHIVYHDWTVTVREPLAPKLSAIEPDATISITKGETVDFRTSVDNPDGRTFSILWNLDGLPLDGDDPMDRTVTFQTSGHHSCAALLVSAEGVSKIVWTINVINGAPVIITTTPVTEDIDITRRTEMTFRTEAEDPDGDDLTYTWSSTGLDLRDLAGPEGDISLPCVDDEPYTITVTVSDGEDEATWAWTVRPDPPVNYAPVLSAVHPSDDPIVIEKKTSITYSVEATDPDGDDLTYTWGSNLLTLEELNHSLYAIDCPCDEKGQYTIWVEVSDGEETVRAEWMVKAEPKEESPEMQNGHIPIGLIIAIVLAACVVAIAYIYWNKTKSGQD